MQDEVRNVEDGQLEISASSIQICGSIGDISVICSIPEPRTVQASELSRLLRIEKQALTELMETYFSDGGIIISNLIKVSSFSPFLFHGFVMNILSCSCFSISGKST